jgi:hypothetical protein
MTTGSNGTVGFKVLTAVNTKMAVFWVVAAGSLAEILKSFIVGL